jgi:hypothetical protein
VREPDVRHQPAAEEVERRCCVRSMNWSGISMSSGA